MDPLEFARGFEVIRFGVLEELCYPRKGPTCHGLELEDEKGHVKTCHGAWDRASSSSETHVTPSALLYSDQRI